MTSSPVRFGSEGVRSELAGFRSEVRLEAVVNGLREPSECPKLRRLYQQAVTRQWNPDTDIEWPESIDFGAPLPPASAFAEDAFRRSSLEVGGARLWNAFRWELQSWLVCQFAYGEQAALTTAARLTMCLEKEDEKLMAASQVADEARHVAAFSRYVSQYLPNPYPLSAPLRELMSNPLESDEWDIAVLGMQVIVEGLAASMFRMGAATFHDPVIQRILDLVAPDEARHLAFGTVLLRARVPELSAAERLYREEYILDAADFIHRRFLLGEIWERLDVSSTAGERFATQSPLMIAFRRTAFAKTASVLTSVGLMSERAEGHLRRMMLV